MLIQYFTEVVKELSKFSEEIEASDLASDFEERRISTISFFLK